MPEPSGPSVPGELTDTGTEASEALGESTAATNESAVVTVTANQSVVATINDPTAAARQSAAKPAKTKGLAKRVRQGISWTAAGATAGNLARLGVYAVLNRLLTATEFGTVSAAMTVILFCNTLRDVGIGTSLVQRKELEPQHIEAASTFSILLGVALGVGTFAGAGLIAGFYHIESSVWIIRVLGLMFILRGASNVPAYLARRHMQFRALAIIDVAGYVAGSALSIGLAFAGTGAWSLAWGYVLEIVINVVALVAIAPPPLGLRLHRRHLRELLGYGTGQSAANLIGYFALNGDYLVVGHVLGAASLGLYQKAYELMRFPATVFTSVASSVLFSGFTKLQDDPERLGRAFRRSLFACALILLPASAGLIVLAPEVIRILLGPGWSGVERPFQIMAISMLFRTTYKLGSLVGTSSGDAWSLALWLVVYAGCVIGGALISVRWDILGVACTTALAVFVVFLAMARLGLRNTHLRWRDILAAHIEPAAYALFVGGAAYLVATALRQANLAYPLVAAITALTGALVFLGLATLSIRRGRGDWPWLRDTLTKLLKRGKAKPAAA